MLNYNEIRQGKFINYEGEPYEVISSHVFRKQQRKPVNQTKLKNLISGKVVEISFHQSEKVDEADLERRNVTYLFNKKGEEFWFCDVDDKSNRFSLGKDIVGDQIKFVKENSEIETLLFNEEIIGIKIPIKVTLKVKDTPPNVKGGTAAGGNKQADLETGATILVPMFIKNDDEIIVNTETGEYVERAK